METLSASLDLDGVVVQNFFHEAAHLFDLHESSVVHIVVLPSLIEVNVEVLLELVSREMEILLDKFSGSFKGTVLINPELWVLFKIIVVHVAAAAIATAVLGELPQVCERLAEAAVAVASAVELHLQGISS